MSKTRNLIKSWETPPASEAEVGVTKPRKEISSEAKKLIKNYESASSESSTQKGDVPKAAKIPGAAKKMIKVYETKEQVKVKEVKEATVTKPDSKKKVFIVYAHGESTSFNAALLATAEKTFASMNMEVTVSDLYKMKFNPVLGRNDMTSPLNTKEFKYTQEIGKAVEDGRLAADIVKEQQKLDQADLVIFQFPLQWMGFPAIMKGWLERVLCYKYAWNFGKIYDQAKFKDKKAVLSFTTGTPETAYTNQGIQGDMNVILWPIQNGVLRYVGFNVLAPQISYGVEFSAQKDREGYLAAWEQRLKTIFSEKTIPFIPMNKFDLKSSMQFNWKALENEGKKKSGPTTGQHMGKLLPENFMTQVPKDEPETPTSPPPTPTATAPATGSAPTQATPPAQPTASSQATAQNGKDSKAATAPNGKDSKAATAPTEKDTKAATAPSGKDSKAVTAATEKDTKAATGTDSAQPNTTPQEVKTNGK